MRERSGSHCSETKGPQNGDIQRTAGYRFGEYGGKPNNPKPRSGFESDGITVKFTFRTRRERINMVIAVCSGRRKKLLHAKLKL